MKFDFLKEKGCIVLFLLFFALNSCCYYSQDTVWKVNSICGACPGYRSTKVSNCICNAFRDIRLELVKTECDWRAFLVVQSIPLVPMCVDDAIITVKATACGEEYIANCQIFEGGQRVLLPDDLAMHIVEKLMSETDVQVRVGRYCCTLPSCGFRKAYASMCKDL